VSTVASRGAVTDVYIGGFEVMLTTYWPAPTRES